MERKFKVVKKKFCEECGENLILYEDGRADRYNKKTGKPYPECQYDHFVW